MKSEVVNIHALTFIKSANIEFFKDIFPFKDGRQNWAPKGSFEEVSSNSRCVEEIKAPRKSKKARKSTSFRQDFVTLVTDAEPQTFNEAIATLKLP